MQASSQDIKRQRHVETLLCCYKRWVSPWFGNSCRFSPSCSEYAAQAVLEHGWLRGAALTVRRVLRCHPFGANGFDPVPRCAHGEQILP